MWICKDCGDKYGKYRTELLSSTWHYDYCGWCKEYTFVTEDRDYGYPKEPSKETP